MLEQSFQSAKKILIVKPSSLGDIVHTLPIVAILKKNFPQAKVSWLVNSAFSSLLENHPHIDDLIVFPRENFRGLLGKAKGLFWLLQHKKKLSTSPSIFKGYSAVQFLANI